MTQIQDLISNALADPRHGWSVGTFGAIGEFLRDAGEPVIDRSAAGRIEMHTYRAAIRVQADPAVQAIAYDTLSSDGETWGQSLAFCLPAPTEMAQGGVKALGADADAIRPEDRGGQLFDLGVGLGLVRFCVRTSDAELIAALNAIEGEALLSPAGGQAAMAVLRAQPHRVLISPIARIEVFAPIPPPDGKSPEGPHTHLLPKLIAARRTHAANAPIPEGLQPVLMLHPRSPWRDEMGLRTPFDAGLDADFERLLADHALAEDRRIRQALEQAVAAGQAPDAYPWPDTRRGRTQARITLRRLAQARGRDALQPWRAVYDHAADDAEPDEEAALHG